MSEKLEKKLPEYLDGFFDGIQHMREIFDKASSDADKLNYNKGRRDALVEVKIEVERNKDKTDSRYDNLHSPANPQDIDEKQLEKIKANLVAKRSFLSGEINGYDKILDFIDKLTK